MTDSLPAHQRRSDGKCFSFLYLSNYLELYFISTFSLLPLNSLLIAFSSILIKGIPDSNTKLVHSILALNGG